MTFELILDLIEIVIAIVAVIVCGILLHQDIKVMKQVNKRLDKFNEWYRKHYGSGSEPDSEE